MGEKLVSFDSRKIITTVRYSNYSLEKNFKQSSANGNFLHDYKFYSSQIFINSSFFHPVREIQKQIPKLDLSSTIII